MFSFTESLHAKIKQQKLIPNVGKSIERWVLSFIVRDNISGLFTEGVQLRIKILMQATTFDPAIPHLKIYSKETTRKCKM